jgi:hypothetical protein
MSIDLVGAVIHPVTEQPVLHTSIDDPLSVSEHFGQVPSYETESTPLGAEEIYEYVRSRLQDIDGQVQDLQGDAADRKKKSDQLRLFQQAVRSLVGDGGAYQSTVAITLTPNGSMDTAPMNEKDAAATKTLEDARAQLKDCPALCAKLDALIAGVSMHFVPAEAIQANLDYAKDQLTSLNSDNELTMMRLNTLFQLRSQIITSGTNEQAAINEGMKAIIGNMRA